jgi:hypothetical protein
MTEPHAEDYEDPEDFAEDVGVDPTPQQVDEYREETAKRRHPEDDEEVCVDPRSPQAEEYLEETEEAADPTGGSGA